MIEQVLKELLYKYNCVVIPNFGGIITREASSQIHPVKNTFTPPFKRLAFNENLKENDGLLVSNLVKTGNISIEEAEQMITKFIQGIRINLEKDGVFHLVEIGFFSYNAEKRIQFKSTSTTNFLEESFGLPDLYFKPIERRETVKNMEKISSPTPRGPIKKEEQVEKHEESKKSVFLILPVILIVAMLASLFLVKDHEGDILMATVFPSMKSEVIEDSNINEAEEESKVSDSRTSEDESITKDDTWAAKASSVNEGWSSNNEVVDATIEVQKMSYHVIAGVFSKKSYAQRLANKYEGEVLKLDGYFKVSVGRYDSKEKAAERREGLVNELGNDIWILTQ